jgi:hypothetical protein
MRNVVATRISFSGTEGKADGCQWPEGNSPGCARARAQDPTGVGERGMPPEGERGTLGEPSVSLAHSRTGGPGDQKPWGGLGASPRTEARQGQPERTEANQVSGRERQAKRPERGRVAVVAAHRTREGGERRPTGPTGGKAPPGITFGWTERREIP